MRGGVVAVLPGAGPADGRVLRREGDLLEVHAATPTMALWRTDTEAYRTGLSARPPRVYVACRPGAALGDRPRPFAVTASPYEAQDLADSGEEVVEPVPMPPGLVALVREFCDAHHVEEPFLKRRRDRARVDGAEDGVGDPRIRQAADVYRSPSGRRGAA